MKTDPTMTRIQFPLQPDMAPPLGRAHACVRQEI